MLTSARNAPGIAEPAKYAAVYILRVLQLIALGLAFYCLKEIIGHLGTGRLRQRILWFAVVLLSLVLITIGLKYLQRKDPGTAQRAIESADQRFASELNPRTQKILLAVVMVFVLLIVGHMMISLY
jgi:hypothetical protein